MKQRSAKSKKKIYSQIFGIAVSLLLAVAVISSAVFLHESHYFNSSESHVLEVLRGMDGKSEVRSWDDDRNLKRRETLLQKGCADNPDMIGWLVLPQTMIDYPLMGGTDSDRYTDHNYEGGYDLYGTPFLDSRNAVDFSDFFSLVFGHDMSKIAADYLASRLSYLHIHNQSVNLGDNDTVQMLLAGLAPGDSVIIFSYSPFYMPAGDVANYVRHRGGNLIVIADNEVSPVVGKGGVDFLCRAQNSYFFNSMSVPLHFVEILAYYVAMATGRRSEDIVNGMNAVGSYFHHNNT